MKCPENYEECEYYKENEPIENQCQMDSTVGYCVKKIKIDNNKKEMIK